MAEQIKAKITDAQKVEIN